MSAIIADRWRSLLGSEAEAGLRELIARYGDAGRHYHNLDHIAALLALSEEQASSLADRGTVDLAILYHDAVYAPSRKDNEEASAALARERLTELGRPAAQVETVARYIEATKHAGADASVGRSSAGVDASLGRSGAGADATVGNSDLDHLLDFDLSILGAEPAAYEAYAAGIRREYAIYPDLLYRPGRAKVLRAFLAMPRIFRVPALAERWDAQARANLSNELARLA